MTNTATAPLSPTLENEAPAPNRATELKALSFQDLTALYRSLPAARLDVLQGEVEGTTLAAASTFGNALSWLSTHSPFPGVWKGKGFERRDDRSGHGYNRFNWLGREHRSMRFHTRLARSRIDGEPVLLMNYEPVFNLLGLLKAHDEVRQLDDRNYIMRGYWQWPVLGQSPVLFYHVYGPVRPFRD